MRILMVADDSAHTEVVLGLGAQIARRAGEAPTVLTVIKHEADRHPVSTDVILARARALLEPDVPNVQAKIRIGHPAEEIIREARENNYDLVIIGEKPRRHLFTHLLLDSTAARVVKRAPCPVIVVKGKVGPIHRILLCDSGAKSPSALSLFTTQLVGLLESRAEVTVLHVMSQMSAGPGVKADQLQASVEELIEECAPEGQLLERDIQVLERSGIHPYPEVRHGLVVDEILRDAQSGNYDLVIIGAYRGKGWQRILLDDLAHKIMVQLDRPVLVVP